MKPQQIEHCCDLMNICIDDPRIPLFYVPEFREYYIPLKKTSAIQCLIYCPWCGTQLPKDLRDEYLQILAQEYNIDDRHDKNQMKKLPNEFKNDMWWKKRGL